MNTSLQKHTIKKKLRNRGINPDKIDLEAELDSSLSLPENIKNLEEKYGKLQRTGRNAGARQDRAQQRRKKQAQKEARSHHRNRPKYNRYVDQTKDAETTYADPNSREMEKWKENPNKYDIEGVDTRTNPSQRPQTKLPIQRNRNLIYEGDKSDLKKAFRKKPDWPVGNETGRLKDPKNRSMRGQMKMMNLARTPGSSNVGDPTDFYEEDIQKDRKIKQRKRSLNFKDRMLRQSGANVRGFGDKLEAGEFGEKLESRKGSRASEMLKDSRHIDQNKKEMKGKQSSLDIKISKKGSKLEASKGSRASELLKDKRKIGTVRKNNKGTTSERSDQESLRDGYANKKSEDTLDKWSGNYI